MSKASQQVSKMSKSAKKVQKALKEPKLFKKVKCTQNYPKMT